MGILSTMDQRNQRALEHHDEVARDGVAIPPGAEIVLVIAATSVVVALVVALLGTLIGSS